MKLKSMSSKNEMKKFHDISLVNFYSEFVFVLFAGNRYELNIRNIYENSKFVSLFESTEKINF